MPSFDRMLKTVPGLLLLGGFVVPSVAQEIVGEDAARVLLRLQAADKYESVVIADVAFSPDGESVAFGSHNGTMQIVPLAEGSRPRVVARGDRGVWDIAFSPDGKWLASGAFQQLKLTDVSQDGEQAEPVEPPRVKGSLCVAFSPDGKLLAAGENWGHATVSDLKTGEIRFTIDPFAGTGPVDTGLYKPSTEAMDFSPDGKLLAVTTDFFDDELPGFEHVQVRDVATGKLRFFFRGVSCGFSRAGDVLAYRSGTYNGDGRIVLLDLETFRPTAVLTGAQFQDARFAPDGGSVAAISRKWVELWTVPSKDKPDRERKRVRRFRHPAKVTSLAFAPDGQSLVTGDEEGTVRLWSLSE